MNSFHWLTSQQPSLLATFWLTPPPPQKMDIICGQEQPLAHLNRDKIESNLSVPGIQGRQDTYWLHIWLLYDEFIWEIWVISETWLDYLKLTCHTSSNTNNVSKNGFTTFKGCKAVLLKAVEGKTSNFLLVGPFELKFSHIKLIKICVNISFGRPMGPFFGPRDGPNWAHGGSKSWKTNQAPY